MRVLAGILLDGLGSTAVGVSLAEDGVDGASLDLVIAGADLLIGIGLRVIRIIRELVSLRLKFGDGCLELRNGGADVWELDDISLWLERQSPQFSKGVTDFLILREKVGECRNNTASQRNVPKLHGNTGMLGNRLNDRQKRVGSQCGSLVGLGVKDGRKLGHDGWELRRIDPLRQSWKRSLGEPPAVSIQPPDLTC